MCGDKNARIILKSGVGVPTIPVSADHRNGDWIATDIYEGESYMDTDTGIVYTRKGTSIEYVGGGAGDKKIWKGLLSQTGTSAPTEIVLENTTGVTAVFAYTSVGIYTITLTGQFTADKVFVTIENANVNGVFSVEWVSANVYNLYSSDTTFTLINDALEKTSISFEIYP